MWNNTNGMVHQLSFVEDANKQQQAIYYIAMTQYRGTKKK